MIRKPKALHNQNVWKRTLLSNSSNIRAPQQPDWHHVIYVMVGFISYALVLFFITAPHGFEIYGSPMESSIL